MNRIIKEAVFRKGSCFWIAALIVSVGLLCFTSSASAAVEDIDWQVVLNQPIADYFQNEFDPNREKELRFDGKITNSTDTAGTMVMFFDWIDPDNPDGIITSKPVSIDVDDGASVAVTFSETVPYCPPLVSLHARVATAPSMDISGTFTHECQVPEPSTALAVGLGLTCVILARRRRR